MTDIRFKCLVCGREIVVPAQAAGLRVRCPDCGLAAKVPSFGEAPQPPVPPVAPKIPDYADVLPPESPRLDQDIGEATRGTSVRTLAVIAGVLAFLVLTVGVTALVLRARRANSARQSDTLAAVAQRAPENMTPSPVPAEPSPSMPHQARQPPILPTHTNRLQRYQDPQSTRQPEVPPDVATTPPTASPSTPSQATRQRRSVPRSPSTRPPDAPAATPSSAPPPPAPEVGPTSPELVFDLGANNAAEVSRRQVVWPERADWVTIQYVFYGLDGQSFSPKRENVGTFGRFTALRYICQGFVATVTNGGCEIVSCPPGRPLPVGCMELQRAGAAPRLIWLNPMALQTTEPPSDTQEGFLLRIPSRNLPSHFGAIVSNADWRCFASFARLPTKQEVIALVQEESRSLSLRLLLDSSEKSNLDQRLRSTPLPNPRRGPSPAGVTTNVGRAAADIQQLDPSRRLAAMRTLVLQCETQVTTLTNAFQHDKLVARLNELADCVYNEVASSRSPDSSYPRLRRDAHSTQTRGSSPSRPRPPAQAYSEPPPSPEKLLRLSKWRRLLDSGTDPDRRRFFEESLAAVQFWTEEKTMRLSMAHELKSLDDPLPEDDGPVAASAADGARSPSLLRLVRLSFFNRDNLRSPILTVDAQPDQRQP